jgi:hypothetical protein
MANRIPTYADSHPSTCPRLGDETGRKDFEVISHFLWEMGRNRHGSGAAPRTGAGFGHEPRLCVKPAPIYN